MLKNKLFLAVLVCAGFCPSVLLSNGFRMQPLSLATELVMAEEGTQGEYSAQEVHRILNEVKAVWTQYNYGTLRSAYNHGTLTIVDYAHPSLDPCYNWVMVKFGGLEICVILDPA